MFSKRIFLISLFFLGQTLSVYSQDEEEDTTEDRFLLMQLFNLKWVERELNFMEIQV